MTNRWKYSILGGECIAWKNKAGKGEELGAEVEYSFIAVGRPSEKGVI